MSNKTEVILIQTTFPSLIEAEKVAEKLLSTQLCACIQLVPEVSSLYIWHKKIQKEKEILMYIKTLSSKYKEIETFLSTNHCYEIPEIISTSIKNISPQYLKWLTNNIH